MARKWKPKPWFNYVLPLLLVSLVILLALTLVVDEFTFMTCDQVRESLLDAHNSFTSIGWDDKTHLKYHEYYEQCLNDGAYIGLSEDGI